MDVTSLVVGLLIGFLVIGVVTGWLGGRLMQGDGLGLPGNIAVGIIGAFAGGFLFGLAPVSVEHGLIAAAPIAAAVGAALVLFIVGLIKKARFGATIGSEHTGKQS
ncbi:MAG: GlsB/YeaQ/YmgE family stress response membrane protein [Pseudomonadota bacterium]|nr:GlsB/YeaQ/YmgE family stress response membrane protein [Pseudomonadota bacterium]